MGENFCHKIFCSPVLLTEQCKDDLCMVFSSLPFLLAFLPLFFLSYYSLPIRYKNFVLLLGSVVFYAVGTIEHPEHLALLLGAIIVDYCAAMGMERLPQIRTLFFGSSIIYHLIWLVYYKLSAAFFTSIDFALPAGISFYTFQGISYLADVYRKKYPAEPLILNLACYIMMFPQLIAGPIVVYPQVQQEMVQRSHSRSQTLHGLSVFVFGLGMKVLLANQLGGLWRDAQTIGFDSISTPLAWMAIFAFSFQLYFDFFGYSLMAIGLGKMMGFQFPVNFDHPYMSLTMTEFWRRWHITLGSWFREYVYIPLGGSRNGFFRTVCNLLIVWLLTGLWHGAGYNFLLWGLSLFCAILMEKLFYGDFLNRHPAIGHLYMLVLIPLSWVLFAADSLPDAMVFFGRLFALPPNGFFSIFRTDYLKYLDIYGVYLLIGFLFSTRIPYRLLQKTKCKFVVGVLLGLILAASVYCMWRGMDDPFLYFRF